MFKSLLKMLVAKAFDYAEKNAAELVGKGLKKAREYADKAVDSKAVTQVLTQVEELTAE